jgi:hypothetical protein
MCRFGKYSFIECPEIDENTKNLTAIAFYAAPDSVSCCLLLCLSFGDMC